MNDWKEYHDFLPGTSSSKVEAHVQGIDLKSQLYDKAADLWSKLTTEQLEGDNGVQMVVDVVYQRDFYLSLLRHMNAFTNF